MKKGIRNLIIAVAFILVAGIYYYFYLPALNIHSAGCWFFVMSLIIVLMLVYGFRKIVKENGQIFTKDGIQNINFKFYKKIGFIPIFFGIFFNSFN